MEGRTIKTEDHSQIHRLYCSLTDRDMRLDTGVHYRWNLFKSKGWTEADLALVVAFIKGRMRTGRRFVESLRLNNLIDPSRFEDDLCDARAEQRVTKPTFRDRVMEGRPKQGVKETVRPVGSFVKDPAGLKALLALRDSL